LKPFGGVICQKRSKAPLVVSDVKRSIRCEVGNPGKDCFWSSVVPPNLSGKTIRSLGKDFCKIPATKMSVEGLQKKDTGQERC
jgi:hypothetical protein